jgi:hypothetical protein
MRNGFFYPKNNSIDSETQGTACTEVQLRMPCTHTHRAIFVTINSLESGTYFCPTSSAGNDITEYTALGLAVPLSDVTDKVE